MKLTTTNRIYPVPGYGNQHLSAFNPCARGACINFFRFKINEHLITQTYKTDFGQHGSRISSLVYHRISPNFANFIRIEWYIQVSCEVCPVLRVCHGDIDCRVFVRVVEARRCQQCLVSHFVLKFYHLHYLYSIDKRVQNICRNSNSLKV